jgi:hypothetical protein
MGYSIVLRVGLAYAHLADRTAREETLELREPRHLLQVGTGRKWERPKWERAVSGKGMSAYGISGNGPSNVERASVGGRNEGKERRRKD